MKQHYFAGLLPPHTGWPKVLHGRISKVDPWPTTFEKLDGDELVAAVLQRFAELIDAKAETSVGNDKKTRTRNRNHPYRVLVGGPTASRSKRVGCLLFLLGFESVG